MTMIRAPGFWYEPGRRLPAALLAPLGRLTVRATARRLARPGWRAPVPVVCCGNAGVGGAGKTTLALDLARRLAERGVAVHCLTRGYGGSAGRRAAVRVDPLLHDAAAVGDEALLLAAAAPCWVAADRAAGARAAIAGGAQLLLMDDGLQHPGLAQDWPLLVVDGAVGFGNGRPLPAGPLREPVAAAAGRAAAAILIGPDRTGARRLLPPALPVLEAELVPEGTGRLRGQRLLAFAGIARPAKFFDALEGAGLALAGRRAFADHRRLGPAALARLWREAGRLDAVLVTTPKDAVRLPAELRRLVEVVGVGLRWRDPPALDALLDRLATRDA